MRQRETVFDGAICFHSQQSCKKKDFRNAEFMNVKTTSGVKVINMEIESRRFFEKWIIFLSVSACTLFLVCKLLLLT